MKLFKELKSKESSRVLSCRTQLKRSGVVEDRGRLL